MSLLQLPEELVADMASHLNYQDVCNFMESSKRNYNVVKYFRKEKLKLAQFVGYMSENQIIDFYTATSSSKGYEFKKFSKCEPPLFQIKKMFEQISEFDSLMFFNMKITNEVVQLLKETKAKIQHLTFAIGEVELSPAELVSLCRMFKISLNGVELDDSLCTDDAFCQIVPLAEICTFDEINCVNLITDKTLMALSAANGTQNRRFRIEKIYNSFTIHGIIKAIKMMLDQKIKQVFWHLGILHENQREDAIRYIENGLFDQLVVKKSEDGEYTVTKKIKNESESFLISFVVDQP